MGLTNDERQSIVNYRIENAKKALSEAKMIMEIGLWNLAANRLYYSLPIVFIIVCIMHVLLC